MTAAAALKQALASLQRLTAMKVRWALERFGIIESVQLAARVSPHHPNIKTLPEKTLYVVGGPGYQKWAYMVCPCGCGERIMLSLAKNRRPRWEVDIDWLGRPTIKPSVWQTDGCYSHFWVKKGRIEWTPDTGRPHDSRVGNEA